jgi:hypothetical protein
MPGGYSTGPNLCGCNDQGTDLANSRGTAVVGASNAYGSYTQLVASTTTDTCAMLVCIQESPSNANRDNSARIAVGAAGVEVPIVSDLIHAATRAGIYSYNYFFPVNIPAGTRISAGVYSIGVTDTLYISVILFDGSFTNVEGAGGADSIGWSAGLGTTVQSGGLNTKSAYSQLVASTARDYQGIFFAIDDHNQNFTSGNSTTLTALFDIAIGAGGSEIPIISNYPISFPQASTVTSNQYCLGDNLVSHYLPIAIPAGTRISVRCQDILNSVVYGVTVYGVYQ